VAPKIVVFYKQELLLLFFPLIFLLLLNLDTSCFRAMVSAKPLPTYNLSTVRYRNIL